MEVWECVSKELLLIMIFCWKPALTSSILVIVAYYFSGHGFNS